jgi:hypothetical protein
MTNMQIKFLFLSVEKDWMIGLGIFISRQIDGDSFRGIDFGVIFFLLSFGIDEYIRPFF